MNNRIHFFIVTIATALLLASSSATFAQRNPTMTSQRDDADRENLYAKFVENKKLPLPERQRTAYDAAKEYLKRYDHGGDEHAPDLRRFVGEYEKVMHDFEVYSLYADKKYLKAFEAGRGILEKDNEDFYVLAVLTEAGFDSAQAGDASLNDEAIGYARRAIELLEANKVKKTDPFANKEIGRGFLNFAVAWFVRTKSPADAAAALVNAAKADSPYKTNPLTYNLLGNAILKGEYAKVSAEYNEKFGNKPPSPEQQAMLAQIMQLGERAIDAYARAVALTTSPEQQEGRAKMLAQLTSLYKSFHNNSDAGLTELIAGVLSKPLP